MLAIKNLLATTNYNYLLKAGYAGIPALLHMLWKFGFLHENIVISGRLLLPLPGLSRHA
jgi:hypothetical protein